MGFRTAIGLTRATAIVAGIIIGASIFVQPSQVSGEMRSVGGVLAVWGVAGLLTLIGALVVAELSSAWPDTGGVYVFLRNAYSPVFGFLWGWAMFWTMHTGIAAAIATIFARYAGTFVAVDATGTRLIAVAAVLVLSAVNYVGVQLASAVQTALTVIKVLAIVLIIVLAFALGAPTIVDGAAAGHAELLSHGSSVASAPGAEQFASALVAGLFAFGGWHMVSYSAGETVDARRTIPRALMIGTILVTVLYVAINAAYLYVLPLAQVSASTRVAADLMEAVLPGRGAARLVSVLVMLSTLGALNGVLLAGPRVYQAMAQDGLLFRAAGVLHPRFQTPHRAIVLQAIWASVLIGTNTFRALFTRVVYTEWIFFALLAAAVLFMRRRSGYAPLYRLRGAALWCVLFIGASAFIVLSQLLNEPREASVGLLLVTSGLPVYYLWVHNRSGERST